MPQTKQCECWVDFVMLFFVVFCFVCICQAMVEPMGLGVSQGRRIGASRCVALLPASRSRRASIVASLPLLTSRVATLLRLSKCLNPPGKNH